MTSSSFSPSCPLLLSSNVGFWKKAPPSPPSYVLEPRCKECQSGGWKPRNPDDPTITSKGIYLHAVKYTFKSSNPLLASAVANRAAAAAAAASDGGAAAATAAAAAAAATGSSEEDNSSSSGGNEAVVEWEFSDSMPEWAE